MVLRIFIQKISVLLVLEPIMRSREHMRDPLSADERMLGKLTLVNSAVVEINLHAILGRLAEGVD